MSTRYTQHISRSSSRKITDVSNTGPGLAYQHIHVTEIMAYTGAIVSIEVWHVLMTAAYVKHCVHVEQYVTNQRKVGNNKRGE